MITFHYDNSLSHIPNHWVKNTQFTPVNVDENNLPLTTGSPLGARYRWVEKYEENYGFLERMGRIALGIILSLTLISFAFSSGRKSIRDLLFSVKNTHIIVEGRMAVIYVSMAGNPPHLGHMNMISKAIEQLTRDGYIIHQVKIALSTEQYLQDKVKYTNISIIRNSRNSQKSPDMLRVFIPREKRIDFLRANIRAAKDLGILNKDLNIDYFDDQNSSSIIAATMSFPKNCIKNFRVYGADAARADGLFDEEKRAIKHAVIVARKDDLFLKEKEIITAIYSRRIVNNIDNTSDYSSSKIQNGAYEQLPESVREEFKTMHVTAQLERESLEKAEAEIRLKNRLEITQSIKCSIARDTGKVTSHGYYTTPSGKKIPLTSGDELIKETQVIPHSLLQMPVESKYPSTEIVVVQKDCLKAAQDELNQGAQRVAVLMFASPLEPGGGMEDGNEGQEEEICRRSDIFGLMWNHCHFFTDTTLYYLVDLNEAHEVNPDYLKMVNNRMLFVPQVTVFREGKDKEYQMMEEPFKVDILVSPPLDRPQYRIVDGKASYTRQEDEEQLSKVMMAQLKASYDNNDDTVILGAFGSGAFENPPELIAKFYKEIIHTYFKGAFKKIVFAILNNASVKKHNPNGNLKPFQDCFNS